MLKNILLASALALPALTWAQGGTSGVGGPPPPPTQPARDSETGIGDYTYNSSQIQRCTTAGGTSVCVPVASAGADAGLINDATTAGGNRGEPNPVVPGAYCGNGVCDEGEDGGACAFDCGGFPSGTGPQIGEGSCGSRALFASYRFLKNGANTPAPSPGQPESFCQLQGATGPGEFAERKTFTTSAANGSAFVVQPPPETCQRGQPRARLTLLCNNGSWQPDNVICGCYTSAEFGALVDQ